MKFSYINNPVKVYFGRGCRVSLIDHVRDKNCLVVTSQNGKLRVGEDQILSKIFSLSKNISWIDDIKSNPGFDELNQKAHRIKAINFNVIVAIGGGSVIDSAKFFTALKKSNNYELKVKDFLAEAISFENKEEVQFVAIPTTFGTGSEVTPFATVWDHRNKKKYSLNHNNLFADYAFVDSELSHSLPFNVTMSTGLDTICQAFESIWNRSMNSYTELLAHRSISDGLSAINSLYYDLNDSIARETISNASLLAGLCISHTKTALCHSISYPLTSNYGIDHGIACAFTMVEVLKQNLKQYDYRFNRLCNSIINCMNIEVLIDNIEMLLHKCNVYSIVKTKALKLENLTVLSDQMIVSERSDNCLFEVTSEIVQKIIINSWDKS